MTNSGQLLGQVNACIEKGQQRAKPNTPPDVEYKTFEGTYYRLWFSGDDTVIAQREGQEWLAGEDCIGWASHVATFTKLGVCSKVRAVISKPEPKPNLVKCDCGHTVERMLVMSASMGSSCPDCYDRMS